MKKRPLIIIGVLIVVLAIYASNYLSLFEKEIKLGDIIVKSDPSKTINNKPVADLKTNVEYEIETVATHLMIPWDIAFASENRWLITERTGQLRVIENGELKTEPLHVFSEISTGGEEGLMSVELDPNYDENKWIYLSLAYQKAGQMTVKVVRFTDQGDQLTDETIIIDNIQAARFHAGCRLAFGPDSKLYITTGDALERPLAQDLNSLVGKILRLNKDGSVPADNPIKDSPIWSYGHRNAQGLDWQPNGELYSSEHGPSVFDGPAGGDEVNRIIKGGNYGWPVVSHEKKQEGMIHPLAIYTPAEAPGDLMIYKSAVLPQFTNHIFVTALKGAGLIHIQIDEQDPDQIVFSEKLKAVDYGRIRSVAEGPDGFIYFMTSNQDGRGNPSEADDQLLRIKPKL